MDRKRSIGNVLKRITFGCLMISGFSFIIWMGPFTILILVLALQILCFREILAIGYNSNKVPETSVPYFRLLCWYFHLAANYFCSIETITPHFPTISKEQFFIKYHRFISFCIYFVGIIFFVLSLVRKHHLKQFKILAWTHTLIIIIVLQSYLLIENIFQGLIWVLVPVSLVILNDILAFLFGRLFGKTPLIKLSPNKTWEGFIGGAIATIFTGFILSHIMCQYQYFTCPIETHPNCTPSYLFIPNKLNLYPFSAHFLAFALFANIIAPFGGFCASGFKRAFNLKDFGDAIPGHGGIMDRFDCQFLMATFVNVYIFTFVRRLSVEAIFRKVLYLDEGRQVQFFHLLRDALEKESLARNV